MDEKQTHWLQQVVGTFSFYARAVAATILHALNLLAASQKRGTQVTVEGLVHFLNYAATHPDAKICYSASSMVLHVHSDASYLTEPKAHSQAGGHHFLSDHVNHPNPGPNGKILNMAKILCNVMSSAAKAEVGALFLNAKEATVLHTTLTKMGHEQPPTPLQTNNLTANEIINRTVKQQQVESNQHELLLDPGPIKPRPFQCLLGPWHRKLRQLVHKASLTQAPLTNAAAIPSNANKHTKHKNAVRVC
jgi:hypothetical protein